MNCDEAFELMTHPADYNCDELQWHLQMCPRCRADAGNARARADLVSETLRRE